MFLFFAPAALWCVNVIKLIELNDTQKERSHFSLT